MDDASGPPGDGGPPEACRAVPHVPVVALPVRPRWSLEATGATVIRVLAAQVFPLVATVGGGAGRNTVRTERGFGILCRSVSTKGESS